MSDPFDQRVAVITGGASGIGKAVAIALARAGSRLVLADIEPAVLESSVRELREDGAHVIGVPVDVSSLDAMQSLADAAWTEFGGVHFVMHNAGVATFGPTQEASEADWRWSINVNLWGCVNGVQAFVPRMIEQDQGGHHVFTASFAGLVPNRALGPYNVTKAAVVALAESLRKDLRGTGMSASVLCPMRVTSNIDRSWRNRPESLGGAIPDEYSTAERASLEGRELPASAVAARVLDAVRHDHAWIHTHGEAAEFVRNRSERILAAFEHAD